MMDTVYVIEQDAGAGDGTYIWGVFDTLTAAQQAIPGEWVAQSGPGIRTWRPEPWRRWRPTIYEFPMNRTLDIIEGWNQAG